MAGAKTIISLLDVDSAGYSSEGNLVEGVHSRGHEIERVVQLVDPSVFTSEEIAVVRNPVVAFETKDGQMQSKSPSTATKVTKVRT